MTSKASEGASWGALFDWDGVVIDSREHHEESWERLGQEQGRSLPEGHFLKGFGRKNEFIIPQILGWTDDPGEIRACPCERRHSIAKSWRTWADALPGVRRGWSGYGDAGVPCSIGSSTHRANIDLSLGLIGLASFSAA
jgi:beta-phosphoglucomutase-like phosphatase (HAD superfamily)